MIGICEQIPKGMSTVDTACPGIAAQDGSIGGEDLLDLNRSPLVDRGGVSQNEAPIAADTAASSVAVDLDRSPVAAGACVAGGEASLNEEPIPAAAGTRASPVVVDLDRSPAAGDGGSQNAAPIAAGTRDSPIDVEALGDEGARNRTGTRRRRLVVVVDLELDNQQGRGDGRTTSCRITGSKRRRVIPVIHLSPDREEKSNNQRNTLVPVLRSSVNAAPNEPVFTCPVCLNKIEQPSTTSCGHVFCEKCIMASIKAQKKCPSCRKKLGPRGFHRVYLPATTDQV